MIFSSNMATQQLWSPGIMLGTFCSSSSLAHCAVQLHFMFSTAVSKLSSPQRHHWVNVKNSCLQVQFIPTKN